MFGHLLLNASQRSRVGIAMLRFAKGEVFVKYLGRSHIVHQNVVLINKCAPCCPNQPTVAFGNCLGLSDAALKEPLNDV